MRYRTEIYARVNDRLIHTHKGSKDSAHVNAIASTERHDGLYAVVFDTRGRCRGVYLAGERYYVIPTFVTGVQDSMSRRILRSSGISLSPAPRIEHNWKREGF